MTNEFGKGYSPTRLKYIRRFYEVSTKCPSVTDQLTYTHYCELIWFEDYNKINYYIKICIEQKLSVRQLRQRIKNNEYERLDNDTKQKLINKGKIKVNDFIKNPILIKNSYNYTKITERILKQLILEDIPNFLSELGEGFCFIKDEYKIKLEDRYNYIDLLLFNIKYNCYVVVELKITELKKEHIGQIQTYMNYIDKHVKTINHDNTIGIIVCAKDNKIILEYSSDPRIYETSYILN